MPVHPRGCQIAMAVYGDLTFDSRVQREARSLAAAGYEVTVACLAAGPATIAAMAPVRVVTVVPTRSGTLPTGDSPFLAAASPTVGADARRLPDPAGRATRGIPADGVGRRSAVGQLVDRGRSIRDRVQWLGAYRANLLGWGADVAKAVGPVDRWHVHDLTGLIAMDASLGRTTPRVYDAHELFVEIGSAARLPWPARRLIARLEGRLARRCAAVVTVNPGIASVLRRRLGVEEIVVVRNCLPRQDVVGGHSLAAGQRPRLFHERLRLDADAAVILFHGNLIPDRGIERLVLLLEAGRLPASHLVCLGNGELTGWLSERAAAPAAAGRLHVLPAVPPDELPALVASADAGVVLLQPADLNLRLSTPNKLWECLSVGTPVVASDFPEIHRVVMDDPDGPLGAVCDPTDDEAIVAALASIVAADAGQRTGLRGRCLRAAHARWNWEEEASRLVALHRRLDLAPAG